MENAIQIFDNPEFGKIRVIMIDGKPWFVAADVCRALALENTAKALLRLDDDEKGITRIHTPGGEQRMLIVNEPGLYRLIFASRKPEAKKFQRWVYHEVLPTLRQTGSYSIGKKPLGQDKSTAARREAQMKPACVYAFEMSNDSVKIGHTSDVQNRISRMPREYGLDVMREHHSHDLPRGDARRIEKTLHRKYASLKIDGEFFRANFPDVCTEIDKLSGTIEANFYEEHEEIAALSEYDRLNLLVKLVAALEPSPLKERLAVEVAQVLLDY